MTDLLIKKLSNAHALRREGNCDAAYAEFQTVAVRCLEQGYKSSLIAALQGLAQIERDRNQPDAALPYYQEAEAIARDQSDNTVLAHTIRHLGDLYQDMGNYESAEKLYLEALDIYRGDRSTGDLELANTLRPMALLLEATSRRVAAKRKWEDAKQHYVSAGIDEGVTECEDGIRRCS